MIQEHSTHTHTKKKKLSFSILDKKGSLLFYFFVISFYENKRRHAFMYVVNV